MPSVMFLAGEWEQGFSFTCVISSFCGLRALHLIVILYVQKNLRRNFKWVGFGVEGQEDYSSVSLLLYRQGFDCI